MHDVASCTPIARESLKARIGSRIPSAADMPTVIGRHQTADSGSGSAGAAVREAQRAVGDLTFRMARPLKGPMRVALTDHLTGVQSVRESSPTECNWPFLSRRSLVELQLRPRRCDLSARDPTCVWSMSVNGLRHFESIGL
jgi:hypothetical protein